MLNMESMIGLNTIKEDPIDLVLLTEIEDEEIKVCQN